MDLSKEEKKKVDRYIWNKIPGKKLCSLCRKDEWEITTKILEIPELRHRSVVGKAFTIPVVSMICSNCSNILFFDASRLEIVKMDEKGLYQRII